MAIFNPDPQPGQVNDPNYFKYSEPVKDIKADTSTGLALTGAATDLDSGASLALRTAQDYIKEDVKKTIEPIRDDFTAQLEAARKNMIPAPAQTSAGGTVAPLMYTDEDGNPTANAPIPAAVKSGIDKISSLQDAYVNGKINDTWYHGNLAQATSGLRAKYAGFTDYIDSEVSKITGVVPANAYVADLMQDLNRVATNKKTEQDKTLDLARGAMTKGFDGANLMYQRLQQDPTFAPKFNEWYTEQNAAFTRLQLQDLQRNNLKGNQDYVKEQQKTYLSDFIGSTVSNNLNGMLKLSGMDKPMAPMDLLQDAANNPGKYSEKQMEEFATSMQSHMGMMKAQLTMLTDQKGYTKAVGVADRDAAVDSGIKVYQAMYDSIRGGGSGGAGLAFAQANQARAFLDQTKNNLTNGDLGQYLANAKIVSDSLGPAASGVIMPMLLGGQKDANGKVTGSIYERLQPLFTQNKAQALAQPDPQNPVSIADHIAQANADPRLTKQEKPFLFERYVSTVKDLNNPQVPDDIKGNIVKYMFGPKSNSLLSNFTNDFYTPSPDRQTQIFHPGKQSVFLQMTDPSITTQVSKLDTESKNQYRNWTDIAGRELIGADVRNLNHFTGHDNLYFEWNSSTKQLTLKDKEGALAPPTAQSQSPYAAPSAYGPAPTPPPSHGYLAQVQATVDRINKVLPNIDKVYGMNGGNTEQMLLQTLQQYGMDFNSHVSGLPKSLGDAVAASRKAPEKKTNE